MGPAFPLPYGPLSEGLHIEVRRMFELDDFVQGEGIAKFRQIEAEMGPRGRQPS